MDWHKCFKRFDTDKSGCISSDELHTALISFGYNISKKMAELLVKRFDRANKNEILFDDFIRCCLILYVSHMPASLHSLVTKTQMTKFEKKMIYLKYGFCSDKSEPLNS